MSTVEWGRTLDGQEKIQNEETVFRMISFLLFSCNVFHIDASRYLNDGEVRTKTVMSGIQRHNKLIPRYRTRLE